MAVGLGYLNSLCVWHFLLLSVGGCCYEIL